MSSFLAVLQAQVSVAGEENGNTKEAEIGK